jgi:hypothetical protein
MTLPFDIGFDKIETVYNGEVTKLGSEGFLDGTYNTPRRLRYRGIGCVQCGAFLCSGGPLRATNVHGEVVSFCSQVCKQAWLDERDYG